MASPLLIGIDIGGTKCAVVIASSNGTILGRKSIATESGRKSPDRVLSELAILGGELVTEANRELSEVIAVGVSCGGPLDTQTGIVHAPPNLPDWIDIPVRDFFERAFHARTIVENDANATALAEHRFGAGRGTRNMVFLTIGTGIGGGIVIDGRLYRGTNDLAGEVGHQTILPNGPLCGCGKRGCLEALASGPSIARLARESLGYGRQKRVLTLAGGTPEAIRTEHIVEAAKEGDAFAIGILHEAGTYLGIGIANLIQILNPERIILGTVAVHAGEYLMAPVREAVREYSWARSNEVCQIVPAGLGDEAQDLAAIALVCEPSR